MPVHTWLPDAAERGARPGTSVLLVSILDKIGTFGMIRFCLAAVPGGLAVGDAGGDGAGGDHRAVRRAVAIGQNDIPRLIAYTSVSHFGFIVLGIFVLTSQGQAGATLYMFNHGLSTGRAVPGHRLPDQPARLEADQRLRRRREGRAGAGRASSWSPGCRAVAARPLAVRLRVPRAGGRVHARRRGRRRSRVLGIVLAALYILLMYQRTMTGPPRAGVVGHRDLQRA